MERLENSAFNSPDKKSSECSPSFQLPDTKYKSYCGIYNSTGKLLKGNELFERYTELAIQLDAKRSAFYLESSENNIIFGCSLSVKADNGREERVVFIQINKNISLRDQIDFEVQLLNKFYKRVKYEVENIGLKKYRLVGLWDEGDFLNIKEGSIEKDFLDYTVGKLNSDKKVSIRITELSNGLSFILKLINRFRNRLSFTLDISQYPSESDVSISLMKQNPDFEIGENGMCRALTQPELWNLYKKQGKENQSLVESVIKEIENGQRNNSDPSDVIYSDLDDGLKVEIFMALLPKVDYPYFKKVLISIYKKIDAPERRRDLHRILLGRNMFIEELVKDLVITIYKEHNRELFNLLFNINTSRDSLSINNLNNEFAGKNSIICLLYTSPSPRDGLLSRMPSSA